MRALLFGLLAFPYVALASPYDRLIDAAAIRHGVDPFVMRAIVQVETGKNPWSINVDGEGFRFGSAQEAVNALWQINQNPWLVRIVPHEGRPIRQFFPNETFARSFLDRYQRNQMHQGRRTVNIRTDDGKAVAKGEGRVRQLWMINTDLGIAQVNYRYHGKSRAYVQRWFDPAFNLDYAASLVAQHKRKHGDDLRAAGYYHSATKEHREKYMAKLVPIFHQEKSNAYPPIAIR